MNTIDGWFVGYETKKYNRNNINNDYFYVFENIKIIISLDKFKDSIYCNNIGELNLLLKESKTFDEDNCFKTTNFAKRRLDNLGDKPNAQSFWFGFKHSF